MLLRARTTCALDTVSAMSQSIFRPAVANYPQFSGNPFNSKKREGKNYLCACKSFRVWLLNPIVARIRLHDIPRVSSGRAFPLFDTYVRTSVYIHVCIPLCEYGNEDGRSSSAPPPVGVSVEAILSGAEEGLHQPHRLGLAHA